MNHQTYEIVLTAEEAEYVRKATGNTSLRIWLKKAVIQQARAINRKNISLDEDLSSVPSEVLMNEKRYRSSPVATRELAIRAIREVKHWNLRHPNQRWCLTNKLLSELTGVTVKAISKAVEKMDLDGYNRTQGLAPLDNRNRKRVLGNPSTVMSIATNS